MAWSKRRTIVVVLTMLLLIAILSVFYLSPSFLKIGAFRKQIVKQERDTLDKQVAHAPDVQEELQAQTHPILSDNSPVASSASGSLEQKQHEPYDNTHFQDYGTNKVQSVHMQPVSTFGMDVDTGSYTIARRFLNDDHMPDKDAIRTEEFINYFPQDYPISRQTLSINLDGAVSPFTADTYLVRVGIKARDIAAKKRKPITMIFVVDVSGSMIRENRLGLVKRSLTTLAAHLKKGDKVGLVTYGYKGKKLLDVTSDKRAIVRALDGLIPGGATNVEAGLSIGYEMARQEYSDGRTVAIILASDGVANEGCINAEGILASVRSDKDKGIILDTVGFGMGNYNDVLMEQLADKGDGSYYYIDTEEEADRLFSETFSISGIVASDAKIQVTFNPTTVFRYRLLGYENRALPQESFEDFSVDAGDVGPGQTVTAFYEVRMKDHVWAAEPLATVQVQYYDTETEEVRQETATVAARDVRKSFSSAPARFQFTTAVAAFAELLRDGQWAKTTDFAAIHAMAKHAYDGLNRQDKDKEFLDLVQKARELEE